MAINYGITNELEYIKFFKNHIADGIQNFAFKGENGILKHYQNIVNVIHVDKSTRRSHGVCNKGDFILVDSNGNKYPISVKMDGVKTSWESADSSLKHLLFKFIECYGRIKIPRQIYVKIEGHSENLDQYVFGDDILPNDGAIIVQTLNNAITNKFNNNTLIINCFRVFTNYDQVINDGIYSPAIVIRKDSSRNKKCPITNGYRIEVIPNYISTPISALIEML